MLETKTEQLAGSTIEWLAELAVRSTLDPASVELELEAVGMSLDDLYFWIGWQSDVERYVEDLSNRHLGC